MPFINGRYHVNPTMGAALEAAREAEAAMLALQDHAQRNGDDTSDSAAESHVHPLLLFFSVPLCLCG